MGTELTAFSGGLTLAVEEQGMGELLKPLVREIHLFDTYIAGTSRMKDDSVLRNLIPGEKLTLQRERNKFDENAVALFTEGGVKAGYIPEKDTVIFSRLLEAGKILIARVSEVKQQTGFLQAAIGIYLVDF